MRWGIVLLLLAACAGSDAQQTEAVDTVAATGIPPEPDRATIDAYIAALDAIDPGIVHRHPDPADIDGDIDIAIGRGRSQCSTISQRPTDRAYLIETTMIRFTSPGAPDNGTWPALIAGRILDVVHRHLCPDY